MGPCNSAVVAKRVAAVLWLQWLLVQMQANSDADEVDLTLIVTLLKYISGEAPYQREDEGGLMLGAVLVFLPGGPPPPSPPPPSLQSLLLTHFAVGSSFA